MSLIKNYFEPNLTKRRESKPISIHLLHVIECKKRKETKFTLKKKMVYLVYEGANFITTYIQYTINTHITPFVSSIANNGNIAVFSVLVVIVVSSCLSIKSNSITLSFSLLSIKPLFTQCQQFSSFFLLHFLTRRQIFFFFQWLITSFNNTNSKKKFYI